MLFSPVPEQGVSRSSSWSSSRSPPGVVNLPTYSGSEYCRFKSHGRHSDKIFFFFFFLGGGGGGGGVIENQTVFALHKT